MALSFVMRSTLDLTHLPPIFLLTAGLPQEELHDLEDDLINRSAPLTYSLKEAKVFLGDLGQKKRAAFELRSKGLWTEEISPGKPLLEREFSSTAKKRRRLGGPTSTAYVEVSNTEVVDLTVEDDAQPPAKLTIPDFQKLQEEEDEFLVIKLEWLKRCMAEGVLISHEPFTIYYGRKQENPQTLSPTSQRKFVQAKSEAFSMASRSTTSLTSPSSILSRVQADGPSSPQKKGHPTYDQHRRRLNRPSSPGLATQSRPPKLQRTTTSEWEGRDNTSLPEPPRWVKDHVIYACLRDTPADGPNRLFIDQLLRIKESRILTLDEIGVRAYSTSIASIASYPSELSSPHEVLRLPGCETKIASLFAEWYDSSDVPERRYLQAVKELEADDVLQKLKFFYDIWGVGADTARKLYYDRGWKDIDDVVEFGWNTLTRVQQIGVKYYDEFLEKIPRAEVESIAAIIKQYARKCRNIEDAKLYNTEHDIELVITGGYRRGKTASGDVDVIVSHRNETFTENLVVDLVEILDAAKYITHTLTLNTTTSDRDQQTLPFRGTGGHGFDSLDKALCVWQDPRFVVDNDKPTKNPNVHRRVDIIVSPWRTVGCAVLGWSGATTFERDIRRFVRKEKGWKFDSSGVRDRGSGLVIDLESPKEGESDSWLDREKRLMEGLGISWREPTLRCTY